LRGETEHLQDLADVLQRVVNPEFPPDQIPDYLPGPQAEIELHLAGIPAEPSVQLQQLLVSQQPLPAGGDFRGQCRQAALTELTLPVVDRRLGDVQDIRDFFPGITLPQKPDRLNPLLVGGPPSLSCHKDIVT